MGQINSIPKGFLDLFNAQQQGKNPPAYVDALSPIVDTTELYLGQTLAGHQIDANSAGPNVVSVTVPENETWLLRTFGVFSFMTAAPQFESWMFTMARFPRTSSAPTAVPDPVVGLWGTHLVGDGVEVGQSDAYSIGSPIAVQAGTILHARLRLRDGGGARTTSVMWGFNVLNS